MDAQFAFSYAICEVDPNRQLTAREKEMDLAERDPDLRMAIWHFATQWCCDYLGQPWADVYEGPCEFPTEYAPDQFGYRTCVLMPAYPNGACVDILLTPNNVIIGALHVVYPDSGVIR